MSEVRLMVGTRKGAFVLDVGRQTGKVGRQRSPFRRLGDIPREGRRPIRIVCTLRSRAAGSAR